MVKIILDVSASVQLWFISDVRSWVHSSLFYVLHFTLTENHVKTYRLSRVLAVCAMTFLVLSLPFWVAIGPVVARQTGQWEMVKGRQ